jgi:diaminohydroxyphosphoribosylaminopyrimidine deaminase/5-amino-6-(5-phosphoribosylamino)uracil reductase
VAGKGFAYLRAHGVDVSVGVLEAEARRLNEAFFTAVTRGRPHVTLKVALSVDGFIAKPGGGPTPISARESLRHAHHQRAHVDALAVGIGTVLADDPRLTVRGVHRPRSLTRVIFDSRLRTPLSARLWQTHVTGPILIVATAAAIEAQPALVATIAEQGGECVACTEHDIADALSALNRRQIRSLVLEGGATMHRAAWEAGVVDRVHLYQSPRRLGNGVRWSLDEVRDLAARPDVERQPLGPDTLIDIDVHGTR